MAARTPSTRLHPAGPFAFDFDQRLDPKVNQVLGARPLCISRYGAQSDRATGAAHPYSQRLTLLFSRSACDRVEDATDIDSWPGGIQLGSIRSIGP